MDQELKRQIILDNYTNPFHKETKESDFLKANSNNVSCIDDINIYVKIDNDKIIDAYFDGEACAISTASAAAASALISTRPTEDPPKKAAGPFLQRSMHPRTDRSKCTSAR